jgi:hypothetical protein
MEKEIKNNLYFYKDKFVSVLPSNRKNGKTAVTVLTSASFEDYVELNKKDYKIKKSKIREILLDKLKKLYDFGEIEVIESATPMTKQSYSNGFEGSTYGVLCSAKQKKLSLLMPKTRFDNIFFVGESIIAPGFIGVFLSVEILVHYFKEI